MSRVTDPRDMQAPSGFHVDRPLRRSDLDPDPIRQFLAWLADAETEGVALPNAMALATADAGGVPSVRHVLLRGLDERGLVFYSNRESRKGRQLAENPHAAIVLYWRELDRQMSADGAVELVGDEESDAYFATRPREAQVGAWASRQSQTLAERDVLDAAIAEVEARFEGSPVPRPPFWGGFRIIPERMEFWQGRQGRLHDRFRYARDADGWRIDRLSP